MILDKAHLRKNLDSLISIDVTLVKSIPLHQFYQINCLDTIDDVRDAFGMTDESDENPSFTKAAQDPLKAESFWKGIAREAWGDSQMFIEPMASVLNRPERYFEQVFLPDNTQSAKAKKICNILQNSLINTNVKFIPLIGGETVLGMKVTNRTAQKIAKRAIEVYCDRSIVFVCVKIAQRSFSVSELEVAHLMYDNGSVAGVGQKGARPKTLEYGNFDKIAKIVSWSCDPQRDEKIQMYMEEEVDALMRKRKIDPKDRLGVEREVHSTAPLFRITKNGKNKVDFDTYLEEITNKTSIVSMGKRKADPTILPDDVLNALHDAYVKWKNPKKGKNNNATKNIGKGKTFKDKRNTTNNRTANSKNERKDMYTAVKELVGFFLENVVYIKYLSGSDFKTTEELMEFYEKTPEEQLHFNEWFGLSYCTFKILYEYSMLSHADFSKAFYLDKE